MHRHPYLPPLLAYLALKVWYRSADAADLDWLLRPGSALLGVVTNDPGAYRPGLGYYHAGGDYLISVECAGFNFFLLAATLLYVLLRTRLRVALLLPTVALLSWAVTVVANTSRVLCLLAVERLYAGAAAQATVHQLLGASVYVFALCSIALAVHYARPYNSPIHGSPS